MDTASVISFIMVASVYLPTFVHTFNHDSRCLLWYFI